MTNGIAAAKKRTISLPGDLLDKALQKSREENRNLSNYIANLVSRDLNGQLKVPKAEEAEAKGSR